MRRQDGKKKAGVMGHALNKKLFASILVLMLAFIQFPMVGFADEAAAGEDSGSSSAPATQPAADASDSPAASEPAESEPAPSEPAADESAGEADGTDADTAQDDALDSNGEADASGNKPSAASEADSSKLDDAEDEAEDDESKDEEKKSKRSKAKLSGKVSVKTSEELIEAVGSADVTEIVLSNDIVIDQALTIDRALTISGAMLARSDRTASVFVVTDSGDLTLKDITLADNGKDGNASKYASAIVNSGALTLNSGTTISGFKAADGGAVYVKSGASLEINGATLSGNMACGTGHAAMGGAVYAESGSSIVMSSGLIDGNTACSANSPDNRNGGMGGGICLARGASMTMDDGVISNNVAGYHSSDRWVTARNGAGGGVFVNSGAGFVMNNGTVSGNQALSGTSGINYYGGGGICIWNSGGYDFSGIAQLNAGSITGNSASLVGGGVYVHNYRLLPMHNAAVVGNAATIHGGGLYLCMVGEVYNYATDGTIFTNNAADGDDGDYAPGDDLWSDEPWNGAKANFHLPERTLTGEAITWYEDTRNNPYSETSEPIEDFTTWFEGDDEAGIPAAKNGNIGLRCDAPYDPANYALIVSGNTAQEGGGIGCNGILEMCNPDLDDVPLTVKKVWGEGIDDASKVEVTVNVFNGQNQIDTLKLNADNDWEATLTGLPADGSYSVAEEEIDGFVASVEQTSETAWEFTITNDVATKPVTFAKTDVAGNEIADAQLALLDEEGNAVVDGDGNAIAWTSVEGETKTIDLQPGTYILTELTAPTGYQVAQNITFSLASDGTVTVKDADGNDVAVDTVTMEDKYAEAFFEKDFAKYLFANNLDQTFSFTMAECDAQGNVLDDVADAVPYERDGLVETVSADDPITITVQNGQFSDDGEAPIDFPQLRYTKPATHYYRVSEDIDGNAGDVMMDEAWFLLSVEVTQNQSTGAISAQLVSQQLFYDGDSYECEDDELVFYNNELMTLSCFSMDYGFAPAEAQELVVQPTVHKDLNGRALAEGEFAFQMVDTTDGGTHATYYADNDAQGKVAFDTLSFNAPGVYTYQITELAGQDATVSYDDATVTMTVEVTYDDNGALQGAPVYSIGGEAVDMPTFVNLASKPIVRVQKTSKDGSGDPLHMAYYGLWMQNTGGADVYLGSEPSDEDGYITFDDVDIQIGESYYFKEVSAPAGHTVDEYPSDLFKVVESNEGYSLVYEGDDNFDADDYSLDGAATLSLMALSEDGDTGEEVDAAAGATGDTAGEPIVLTYAKEGKGVQDEVVKLEVSKFDEDTHEAIEGAEFEIIDEASGNTMATWTSGEDAMLFERVLNVDTRYILRETKAPEGYDKAADTVFTIGEYGDLQIINGVDAELTGKTSLCIYDDRLPVVNEENREVVDKTERTVTDSTGKATTTSSKGLSKTGDTIVMTISILLGVLAASGLIAALLLKMRKRRS